MSSRTGSLYALVGDERRASREVWRVDLATSEVNVLAQFVAEPASNRGDRCPRHGLAIGATPCTCIAGRSS